MIESAVLGIIASYSYYKRPAGQGANSDTSFEVSVIILVLLSEAIFISLAFYKKEISDQIEGIVKSIDKQKSNKEIALSDQQDQSNVSKMISGNIAAFDPALFQRVIRHICVPISLPGDAQLSDSVVGESFRRLGTNVTYILVIPPRYLAANNVELANVRKEMLSYLFKFLTSKLWDDPQVAGFKDIFQVLVSPNICTTSSWDVKIDNNNSIGGFIGYDTKWMKGTKLPSQQFYVLLSKDNKFTNSLADNHDYAEIIAKHFVNSQFNSKNEWEREPWAIFPMSNGSSIKPIPYKELVRKIDQIENKWMQEDTMGKKREYPPYLKDLIEIKDSLKSA